MFCVRNTLLVLITMPRQSRGGLVLSCDERIVRMTVGSVWAVRLEPSELRFSEGPHSPLSSNLLRRTLSVRCSLVHSLCHLCHPSLHHHRLIYIPSCELTIRTILVYYTFRGGSRGGFPGFPEPPPPLKKPKQTKSKN